MLARVVCVALTGLAATARAGTVDVITNDPAFTAEAQQWLAARGLPAPRARLDAQRAATLRDCMVIEEPACARAVVTDHAEADAVIYIQLDRSAVAIHWLPKHGELELRKDSCDGCTTPQLHQRALQQLATLTAVAATPAATATVTASKTAPPSAPERRGFAVGLELGVPTSATAAWFSHKLAVVGAIGTGTLDGVGLALRAAVQLEVARLAPSITLRAGLGARRYHHGYRAASIDELPDSHTGVLASVSAHLDRGPLQLYAELAPGVDVIRTRSCAIASGPDTICPHAQEPPLFVHLLVGARWFLF